MKRIIILVIVCCLIVIYSCGCKAKKETAKSPSLQEMAAKLYDKDRKVRSSEASNLRLEREKLGTYLEDKLKMLLQTPDNSWWSPTHWTIEALGEYRIDKPAELLVQNIDYTIDRKTMPGGMKVTSNVFYPVADALRKIRGVPARKAIVERLKEEINSDTVMLCTWVLCDGYGADVAGFLLENEAAKTQDAEIKERLLKAKELFKDGRVILKRPE